MGYLKRASEFTADMLEKKGEGEKNDETEKKDKLGKNNVPLIQEILQLRKEISGLLGFNNYAGELATMYRPDNPRRAHSHAFTLATLACFVLSDPCRNEPCFENGAGCCISSKVVQPHP